jgi:hypothetical protein
MARTVHRKLTFYAWRNGLKRQPFDRLAAAKAVKDLEGDPDSVVEIDGPSAGPGAREHDAARAGIAAYRGQRDASSARPVKSIAHVGSAGRPRIPLPRFAEDQPVDLLAEVEQHDPRVCERGTPGGAKQRVGQVASLGFDEPAAALD